MSQEKQQTKTGMTYTTTAKQIRSKLATETFATYVKQIDLFERQNELKKPCWHVITMGINPCHSEIADNALKLQPEIFTVEKGQEASVQWVDCPGIMTAADAKESVRRFTPFERLKTFLEAQFGDDHKQEQSYVLAGVLQFERQAHETYAEALERIYQPAIQAENSKVHGYHAETVIDMIHRGLTLDALAFANTRALKNAATTVENYLDEMKKLYPLPSKNKNRSDPNSVRVDDVKWRLADGDGDVIMFLNGKGKGQFKDKAGGKGNATGGNRKGKTATKCFPCFGSGPKPLPRSQSNLSRLDEDEARQVVLQQERRNSSPGGEGSKKELTRPYNSNETRETAAVTAGTFTMAAKKRQEAHTVLVYHESQKDLAKEIKKYAPSRIRLVHLDWKSFADGWPDLCFTPRDVHKLQDPMASTCFLASFHEPTHVFEQMSIIWELPRVGARNLRVVCPWFATGTMERVETLGQIATARTMAKMLEMTPPCKTGPCTMTLYDIHALQQQFYFNENVFVELKSAIFLLRQKLTDIKLSEGDNANIAIGFPDDGAQKRFGAKFPDYPHVIMTKERKDDQRKVRLKEGECEGRHVILVDDLVQTGGTLLESMKVLREMGAKKISCFVTHGAFPNDSWKRFTNVDGLHRFWLANTIPTTTAKLKAHGEPFEVLSVAPLIGYLCVGAPDDVALSNIYMDAFMGDMRAQSLHQ